MKNYFLSVLFVLLLLPVACSSISRNNPAKRDSHFASNLSKSDSNRVSQGMENILGKTISDDLEICPNPNPSGTKVEVLEGYTCKVPVVETRPDSDEGYKGEGYVQWTLMKKEGEKEIWAAHTLRWGLIYVGDIEDSTHTFYQTKEVCENKEIVINGEKIKMTLPEIGFGKGGSDIDNPLNFELLKYLNYTSVVSERARNWFWSSSPSDSRHAWVFRPASGKFRYYYRDLYYSVRCVGR